MFKNVPENQQDIFAAKVAAAHESLAADHTKPYDHPKTKEDYWATVDEYWPELLQLILTYAPATLDELVGDKKAVAATKLKQERSVKLCEMFNQAWASAPDDGRIHLLPAWNVLCDLCSECHLLFEEEDVTLSA